MPSRRRAALALAAAVAAGAATAGPAGSASQEPGLTPDGPATIRAFFNGPSTLEGRPPEVLVRWGLTVLPGGNGGAVRLQVLNGSPGVRVVGSSPGVQLPAEAGTYEFDLPWGIPYDPRQHGLAIEQETGGHQLLEPSERPEDEVHLFRPPLADDAQGATATQTLTSRRLRITGVTETDLDGDLVGDQTRDVGDLRALAARVVGRAGDGLLELEARVRNVGTTVRHRPGIRIPDGASGWRCPKPGDGQWRSCAGDPLGPGSEQTVRLFVQTPDGRVPETVTVAAEGPDLAPADNTIAVASTPALTLAKVPGGATPRVRLGVDRPGAVRLRARIAGIRIDRTITFLRAERRVVRLLPARAADRRRLARALRRPGRLTASVTATLADGAAALRARF